MPSRLIVYGKAGCGKTTWGAFAPKPVFLMTPGENGLLTLLDYDLVPATVDYFPVVQDWRELMARINYLRVNATDHKTLIIDVANGAERLCHEHVCKSDPAFKGSWSAFMAYGKGPENALSTWVTLFSELDRLRAERNIGIILLAHARCKRAKLPEGDYDKYQPDISDKGWEPITRWADATLFMHSERVVVADGNGKPKAAIMGRKLYTVDTPFCDAKNRFTLPPEIELPDDHTKAFRAFANILKDARKKAVPVTAAPQPEPTLSTEA